MSGKHTYAGHDLSQFPEFPGLERAKAMDAALKNARSLEDFYSLAQQFAEFIPLRQSESDSARPCLVDAMLTLMHNLVGAICIHQQVGTKGTLRDAHFEPMPANQVPIPYAAADALASTLVTIASQMTVEGECETVHYHLVKILSKLDEITNPPGSPVYFKILSSLWHTYAPGTPLAKYGKECVRSRTYPLLKGMTFSPNFNKPSMVGDCFPFVEMNWGRHSYLKTLAAFPVPKTIDDAIRMFTSSLHTQASAEAATLDETHMFIVGELLLMQQASVCAKNEMELMMLAELYAAFVSKFPPLHAGLVEDIVHNVCNYINYRYQALRYVEAPTLEALRAIQRENICILERSKFVSMIGPDCPTGKQLAATAAASDADAMIAAATEAWNDAAPDSRAVARIEQLMRTFGLSRPEEAAASSSSVRVFQERDWMAFTTSAGSTLPHTNPGKHGGALEILGRPRQE
jgi:hypothetical protein